MHQDQEINGTIDDEAGRRRRTGAEITRAILNFWKQIPVVA